LPTKSEVGERFNLYLAQVTIRQLPHLPTRKWVIKAGTWVLVMAAVVAPSLLHSQLGIGFSPLLTGSMRPSAQPGDVFVTAQVKASTLHVGDIIAIHNQVTGVFYSHRIYNLGVENGLIRITTKGDANSLPESDPYIIGRDALVAKEVFKIKWVGRPMVYLTSVQGRNTGLSILVIGNVMALLYFLFRKEQRKASNGEKIYRDLYAEMLTNQNQELSNPQVNSPSTPKERQHHE
jgi:signal peptidase I